MLTKSCLLLALLCALFNLTFLPAQTAQLSPVPQPNALQPADDAELQAMKAEAQKMRVMLNQMRTNLAFVDTTQSPLKHQFELETDMWQMQIDQVERRIERLGSVGKH